MAARPGKNDAKKRGGGKRRDLQAEGEKQLVAMGMEEVVAAEHRAEGRGAQPKTRRRPGDRRSVSRS